MRNKLKALQIKTAADGILRDGAGLQLEKAGETGKWIYRYSHLGKRREMGLGPWPEISLADARAARDLWAAELVAGRDPIAVRDAQRAAEIAERDKDDPTFADLTATVFEAKKAGLRGEGTRGRWMSPLTTHILPKIGNRRVSTITRHDIADALRPIWRTKYPTALKAYNRIKQILTEGKFIGHACEPFEAEAAKRILGEVRHKETPHRSTPWQDIPALYQRLGTSIAEECLRWMILTCVRADGCTGARFDEIEGDVWTVPADRVKGIEGKVEDFRVPLSAEALRVLARARERDDVYLFTAMRGQPISNNACEQRLKDMGEYGTPHGFRTSFKTWTQDTESCAWEVSETVLGHTVGNKVSRAYARSDLLDRRRIAMEAWAAHVTGRQADNVVSITTAKAAKT